MLSINIYTLKQVRVTRLRYDIEARITGPKICYQLLNLTLDLKQEPVEKFGIISLNTKYKPTGIHVIGVGSLESVTVEPREVFKAAMTNNAFAIIAFHNHPSGDVEPSVWDVAITHRLKEVGDFLDIKLIDHLIVGEGKYVSLKEMGIV